MTFEASATRSTPGCRGRGAVRRARGVDMMYDTTDSVMIVLVLLSHARSLLLEVC